MRRQNLLRLTLIVLCASFTLGSLLVTPEPAGALPSYTTFTPAPNRPQPRADGTIELTALSAPGTAWTVVQWQGVDRNWYDVEGWQGTLDHDGNIEWGVAPADFGHGPFRWVVYGTRGGPVWGMSTTFTLSTANNKTVAVTVTANTPGTPTAPAAWAFTNDKPALSTSATGCGTYAIAGQVLDLDGQPLNAYRLQLVYPDGDKEIIPSGGAPDYGRSGFGFLLGRRRPNRLYQLQLFGPGSASYPISAPVPITFTGACDQNFAWVVFRQVSP
jgi:hypothetical protein